MKVSEVSAELDALRQIYGTTRGYCHCCRRKLAFGGYARTAGRGAWDIDARALRPACCACLVGPAPKARHERVANFVREAATVVPVPVPAALSPGRAGAGALLGGLVGGLLGAVVFGPWGALLGGVLGAEIEGADAA